MGEIERNIAENITKLRKSRGLTQYDLATKLEYSDKSVSKWERGESTPDITILNAIANLFGVTVDYLLVPHDESEINKNEKDEAKEFLRNLLVAILWGVGAFTIATVIFIYAHLSGNPEAPKFWISYVCAAAICCLISSIYAKKHNYQIVMLVSNSLLLWMTITSVFSITLVKGLENVWMFYLIGVPIQAAILIGYLMKKTK